MWVSLFTAQTLMQYIMTLNKLPWKISTEILYKDNHNLWLTDFLRADICQALLDFFFSTKGKTIYLCSVVVNYSLEVAYIYMNNVYAVF